MAVVVNCQVMEEADVDEDDKLSYAEFQNIVSRAPNFAGYDAYIIVTATKSSTLLFMSL